MADSERIRITVDRNTKALSLRPSMGQSTARTLARLRPGLECEIVEGGHGRGPSVAPSRIQPSHVRLQPDGPKGSGVGQPM